MSNQIKPIMKNLPKEFAVKRSMLSCFTLLQCGFKLQGFNTLSEGYYFVNNSNKKQSLKPNHFWAAQGVTKSKIIDMKKLVESLPEQFYLPNTEDVSSKLVELGFKVGLIKDPDFRFILANNIDGNYGGLHPNSIMRVNVVSNNSIARISEDEFYEIVEHRYYIDLSILNDKGIDKLSKAINLIPEEFKNQIEVGNNKLLSPINGGRQFASNVNEPFKEISLNEYIERFPAIVSRLSDFQKKQVDRLNESTIYQEASIEAVLLDLVMGNEIEDVYYVLKEVCRTLGVEDRLRNSVK